MQRHLDENRGRTRITRILVETGLKTTFACHLDENRGRTRTTRILVETGLKTTLHYIRLENTEIKQVEAQQF